MIERRVSVQKSTGRLAEAVAKALDDAGLLKRLDSSSRIALKPNFTYPYFKEGVTTSPNAIRETVKVLRDYTSHIALVETDGGYGAWLANEAFSGHGVNDLAKEFGIEIVNLCDEPQRLIDFQAGNRTYRLPLPVRLLEHTDLLISMPVPKIHCMTGLSLAYKNQWGCIPDTMRLRRHYIFDAAIVAINRALRPAVLADGTWFLDQTGPMEGHPVRMDLVIAASDAGTFDRYVSELMGYPWQRVSHLRCAAALGDMPERLEDIVYNAAPHVISQHRYTLRRSFRNWIALSGFKSRFMTWFGYESWFGRVVLHGILYAIAGRPIKPQPNILTPQKP